MGAIRSLARDLQPFAQALVDAAADAGLRPRVTSARRTAAWGRAKYRECLRRRGTRNPCKYPVAYPGTSKHEKGLAFDVVVTPLAALNDLGLLWESWGGRWGGRFKDPIHFEAP